MFTDQSKDSIKIIDFGCACTQFRKGWTYVGTRLYRAPECVLGLPYDNAIDMWSFGCILFEMLTGSPPFPAHDEEELLDYIVYRIGKIPQHMIDSRYPQEKFFDEDSNLIGSKWT